MFARFREVVDWRFVLSAAFLILVVQLGFNSWSDSQHNDRLVRQLEHVQLAAEKERQQASEERAVLVEGQRKLRRDYQLLLDYLEQEGITVPPNLARTIVAGSGEDDDDGDTVTRIEVRPNTSGSTSSPSSTPSPSGSFDAPDPVENLTDEVEGTVDETRKMTEDTIRDLTDNLGSIVE